MNWECESCGREVYWREVSWTCLRCGIDVCFECYKRSHEGHNLSVNAPAGWIVIWEVKEL